MLKGKPDRRELLKAWRLIVPDSTRFVDMRYSVDVYVGTVMTGQVDKRQENDNGGEHQNYRSVFPDR